MTNITVLPDLNPHVSSTDFSWLILGVNYEGLISVVEASQGFHDTDMLGSFNLMDLLPEDTSYHQSCVIKVKPHIDEDCAIDYSEEDAEILYQFKDITTVS